MHALEYKPISSFNFTTDNPPQTLQFLWMKDLLKMAGLRVGDSVSMSHTPLVYQANSLKENKRGRKKKIRLVCGEKAQWNESKL